MFIQILKSVLIALAAGFVCQLFQGWLSSTYLTSFLEQNLVNLLVALLAVNSATMGIVLTKIRDLVEKHGQGDAFGRTKRQMLVSIKEQIGLILVAMLSLMVSNSPYAAQIPNGEILFGSLLAGVFVYGMMILYDTAKSVLLIIDFKLE